jgi:hypothetical protein
LQFPVNAKGTKASLPSGWNIEILTPSLRSNWNYKNKKTVQASNTYNPFKTTVSKRISEAVLGTFLRMPTSYQSTNRKSKPYRQLSGWRLILYCDRCSFATFAAFHAIGMFEGLGIEPSMTVAVNVHPDQTSWVPTLQFCAPEKKTAGTPSEAIPFKTTAFVEKNWAVP